MYQHLILTDSPDRAEKLANALGRDWQIITLNGPVADLPLDELGVDIADNFKPTYRVRDEQRELLDTLKDALARVQTVYVATSPTIEGEAHAFLALRYGGATDQRIARLDLQDFSSPQAIQAAFNAPRRLDRKRIEAFQTRRIIDRLLAFLCAPALGKLYGEPVFVTPGVAVVLDAVAAAPQLTSFRRLNDLLPQFGLSHAPTIQEALYLVQREDYVLRTDDKLMLSEAGAQIRDLIAKHATFLTRPRFHRRLEQYVNAVEQGKAKRVPVLRHFWQDVKPHIQALNRAALAQLKRERLATDADTPRRPLLLTPTTETS